MRFYKSHKYTRRETTLAVSLLMYQVYFIAFISPPSYVH